MKPVVCFLMFKENRIKIAHEIKYNSLMDIDSMFVITAKTEELQKFLLKFGNDERAFSCENNEGLCVFLTKHDE